MKNATLINLTLMNILKNNEKRRNEERREKRAEKVCRGTAAKLNILLLPGLIPSNIYYFVLCKNIILINIITWVIQKVMLKIQVLIKSMILM